MIRVAERRRVRNRSIKSAVKTFIRKAERGITAATEDSTALVVQAISKLDKAASKGVLHPRNAARRKSRLMKKLNQAAAAES
jgi:small subunit ribosomal protein S20